MTDFNIISAELFEADTDFKEEVCFFWWGGLQGEMKKIDFKNGYHEAASGPFPSSWWSDSPCS